MAILNEKAVKIKGTSSRAQRGKGVDVAAPRNLTNACDEGPEAQRDSKPEATSGSDIKPLVIFRPFLGMQFLLT